MRHEEVLATLLRERVIGIVRLDDAARVAPVVEAIHAGGVRCIEVSLTTPDALAAVREVAARLPGALIGVGTVCEPEEAEAAVQAGASFVVTPITSPELAARARALRVPIAMGALTPTEIHTAHRSGADLVKVFPASTVGPGYLRAVLAPLPRVRLVPTGGVDVRNAREWLAAGAAALGVGGGLTDPVAVAAGRYDELTRHAERLMASVRD